MKIDFDKFPDRLAPTIIQDARTRRVLMLGYLSAESLKITEATGKATFFSRSRRKLWTKGETSGNFLLVQEIFFDCDQDAILIKAIPTGAVYHTGAATCFNENNENGDFLAELEKIIRQRNSELPENSYTAKLLKEGIKKISQKVGEEAVEVVIAAQCDDDEELKSETADLLYHLLILLAARNISLDEISGVLRDRRR